MVLVQRRIAPLRASPDRLRPAGTPFGGGGPPTPLWGSRSSSANRPVSPLNGSWCEGGTRAAAASPDRPRPAGTPMSGGRTPPPLEGFRSLLSHNSLYVLSLFLGGVGTRTLSFPHVILSPARLPSPPLSRGGMVEPPWDHREPPREARVSKALGRSGHLSSVPNRHACCEEDRKISDMTQTQPTGPRSGRGAANRRTIRRFWPLSLLLRCPGSDRAFLVVVSAPGSGVYPSRRSSNEVSAARRESLPWAS